MEGAAVVVWLVAFGLEFALQLHAEKEVGRLVTGRVGAMGRSRCARSPDLDRLEWVGCCDGAAGRYATGNESAVVLVSTLLLGRNVNTQGLSALTLL